MNGQGRYASQGAVASNGDESRISDYFFPGFLCASRRRSGCWGPGFLLSMSSPNHA